MGVCGFLIIVPVGKYEEGAARPRRRNRQANRRAGTGKLTAALVALGAEIIAVEPDRAMLTELRRALPTVRALTGSAEAVPLPDLARRDGRRAPSKHWPGRPARLARAGRVPARAAPHRRLPRRDNRDEGGVAGTRGHARSDPRFPREQTRDRPRRVHPPDADRRAPRSATVKAIDRPIFL
jgi:hypothetical protein